VAERLSAVAEGPARLAALNKVDAVAPSGHDARSLAFRAMLPAWEVWEVSAARGDGCEALLERLIELLPLGPAFFPEDQVTDAHERDIAAELIRAAAMDQLRDEVPHSLAVRIEDFQERGEVGAHITATLFVERESQKGIVIGRGGQRLKSIGRQARLAIEAMSGRSCYLDLTVRVLPGWRDDPRALRELGLHPASPGAGGDEPGEA
jgi:GTP-binding protein Era